jgi:integrase
MGKNPVINYSGFADYLKLKDTRQVTIDRHLRSLRHLEVNLSSFDYLDVKKYIETKKISGTSGQTLNQVISTIRLYAISQSLDSNLYKYPLFPRTQTTVRRTLPDNKIEEFLAAPRRGRQTDHSWRMWNCFWALIAFLALRPSEAKQLLKSDIDLLNKQVILRPEITKTNQFDTMPLFPNIFPLVKEYVDNAPDGYLFPSPWGAKDGFLSQKGWDEDFRYRLKYIGVEKVAGLVPYSLRHSAATRWISNDMNLYKVRRLMRHVKIEQTLTYEHMTSAHLVNSVIKYDPLVRKFANPKEVLSSFKEAIESFGVLDDLRFSELFRKGLIELIFNELERLRAIAPIFFIFVWVTCHPWVT